jgi:hypothetical protein
MDAPDLIQMQGNLPVIDYRGGKGKVNAVATERCPTGAIVWLSADGPVKGHAARAVVRHGALADEST